MASTNASGSTEKRSMTKDFLGDVPADKLVPLDKVDAALTQKGSPLETEVRFINGRLTTVWKLIPDSVRDLWMLSVEVSIISPCQYHQHFSKSVTDSLRL